MIGRQLLTALALVACLLGAACAAPTGGAPTAPGASAKPAAGATSAPAAAPAASGAAGQPAVTSSAPAPAAPRESEKLDIGIVTPGSLYWAAYLGVSKGWFAEEGFEPEIVYTQSSSNSAQQVSAGGVHVGSGTPDVFVLAIDKGAPITIMAANTAKAALSVVTQPTITSWVDLRGKTIGVSALKGGELALLRRLLATKGLTPTDYDVIIAGATPSKLAALRQGGIAAGVLFAPSEFAAADEGFRILGNTAELPAANQVPLAVYGVQKAWAAERERGNRVARVLYRANQFLNDPRNKDEAIAILAETTRLEPAAVQKTYALWMEELKVWTPDGAITAEAVQRVLEQVVEDGDISAPPPPATNFFDPSFIAAAARR